MVERAHERGISVEAELGMLGGVEEDIAVSDDHACLTDPDQAVEFVERSGLRFAGRGDRHVTRRL